MENIMYFVEILSLLKSILLYSICWGLILGLGEPDGNSIGYLDYEIYSNLKSFQFY